MRVWQDRVLDLTKSNPLICLNRSRVSKLRVTAPDASTLFRRIVLEEATLRLPFVRKRSQPTGADTEHLFLDAEPQFVIEPGDLTFDAKPVYLMRALKRLYDNARTTVEERGVTTLHLTFGALRWKDELFGDSVSPLWMVPCELESKGPGAALRLRVVDEEPQLNPALEYCLRERHKIHLPEIPDEAAVDTVTRLLEAASKVVLEQHWEVVDEIWLSTFSFESLVIYRDLQNLTDAACQHAVVATLARALAPSGGSEALPHDLDTVCSSGMGATPVLSTDSSQLEALTVAAAGQHVVVHGPPGTGKSQTIANLIADALGKSRTVLFVSAKMAALNVVHDRLKELGLQRFCLEAHSTKAGKQKIIDELRRTLEHEAVADPEALEREVQALHRVRQQLNGYAADLHKRIEPLGTTVYRANGKLAALHEAPDLRSAIPWPTPLTVSWDELDQRLTALEELAGQSNVFDQGSDHPWFGFHIVTFGVTEEETLEGVLRELEKHTEQLCNAAVELKCLIAESSELSLSEWTALCEPLRAVSLVASLPAGWSQLSPDELEHLATFFEQASKNREDLDGILKRLRDLTTRTPSQLVVVLADVDDRFGSWYAPMRPGYRRWRNAAREVFRSNVGFSRTLCKSVFMDAKRAEALQARFETNAASLATDTALTRCPSASELNERAKQHWAAAMLRRALAQLDRTPVETVTLTATVRRAVAALARIEDDGQAAFSNALLYVDKHWPKGFIGELPVGASSVKCVQERVNALLGSMHLAREWFRLSTILTKCAACGLSPFIEALTSVGAARAPEVFEKRFYRLWISAALELHPTLTGFDQAKGADLLEKHRVLDTRVRQLAIARAHAVASTTATKVKVARDVPDSEVGILRYELQKRKRVKPLRKLFAEIPQVLQALKPCLLMSPISVSTYLNTDALRFDVVIFDEASQLRTAEAVPAILRATQVVVAGDPNQLPPTAFFETSLIAEDDENDDDDLGAMAPLESLLDDCVAIVPLFTESHLRWHYRSRDERLIKFSNHYFYDNRLITFPTPSPATEGQGVSFVYVPDGIYDRGRSRTNRQEARVVARLAIAHFDRFPDRSLGVVALGLSQREAIEDAISTELATRPDIAPFFDSSRQEAYFVKSLENVQGDERDTMLISVGYGHDEHGGLSMNFGPINQDGGWRRLNVLVTRAKWECIVVSSVLSSELAAINPNNRGGTSLRAFLEFAERVGELPAPPAVPTEGETNDFEDAVRAALVDRGFIVDGQVGAGHYRIDLAVRDPREPTRYVLGVECDGASYHSSRTARDRDLLRQQVLRGMGWRIHRVWSTEWFYEREKALEAIIRSVEQAEARPSADGIPIVSVQPVITPSMSGEKPSMVVDRQYASGLPYQLYRPSQHLDRDDLLHRGRTTALARTIGELVAVESPVHYELLVERLKELHGVERAGSNVQENIRLAIRQAVRWQIVTCESQSRFLYDPARQVGTFRTPANGVSRRIDQIAPEELAMAVLHLIEVQFGVAEDRTPVAVARLFGIERLGSEHAEIIESAIDSLITNGKVRRAGVQLCLA